MEILTSVILGVQVLVWLLIIVALIALAVRRYYLKKQETFQERDN